MNGLDVLAEVATEFGQDSYASAERPAAALMPNHSDYDDYSITTLKTGLPSMDSSKTHSGLLDESIKPVETSDSSVESSSVHKGDTLQNGCDVMTSNDVAPCADNKSSELSKLQTATVTNICQQRMKLKPIRVKMTDKAGREKSSYMFATSDGRLFHYDKGILCPASNFVMTVNAKRTQNTTEDNPIEKWSTPQLAAMVDRKNEPTANTKANALGINLTTTVGGTVHMDSKQMCTSVSDIQVDSELGSEETVKDSRTDINVSTPPVGRKFTIGNLGSMSDTRDPTEDESETTTPPPPAQTRKKLLKYPNIGLAVIPTTHHLLDHDYTYDTYCSLVEASIKMCYAEAEARLPKKVWKSKKIKPSMTGPPVPKSKQPKAPRPLDADGNPVKRKYRTKRIIAAEKEAERRAELQTRASQGDAEASEELARLVKVEEEAARLEADKANKRHQRDGKTNSKKKSSTTESDDSEELFEDLTESETKDDFYYFGAKKYKSKTRNLATEDKYKPLWIGAEATEEKDPSGAICTNTKYLQSVSGDMVANPGRSMDCSQEINDVLDILGIVLPEEIECKSTTTSSGDLISRKEVVSPSESVTTSQCQTPANSSAPSPLTATSPHFAKEEQSPLTTLPETNALPELSAVSIQTLTENKDSGHTNKTDELPETLKVSEPVSQACLDEILCDMTADQISAVIQALESDVCDASQATTNATDSVETNTPPKLCKLAMAALDGTKSNQHKTEPDVEPASNQLPLDIEQVDFSDREIDLALLGDLQTPPRPSALVGDSPARPISMASLNVPVMPTESAAQPPVATWSEETFKSPIVVPISMYWNTFPGLLLDGVKYVRLIDISRQALPSKDTGLLKRRAQVLGYEVANCTDLQRNLLVRYAFACPSRSNLMVSEAAAAEIIASYMEKEEIVELSKPPEMCSFTKPEISTTVKPSDVVTLMPQTVVQHKPLQQSKSVSEKPVMKSEFIPERSSRLRQVKSSYRRFLNLDHKDTSTSTSVPCYDEAGSDRGYHSDQSPEANKQPRLVKPKPKKVKKTKVKRECFSINTEVAAMTPVDEEKTLVVVDEPVAPSPVSCADVDVVATPELPKTPLTIQTTLATTENPGQNLDALTPPTPLASVTLNSEPPIHIRHVDLFPRKNGISQSQDGDLYMQFFKSLHAPCIQCCTCKQFYAVKAFTKHQHRRNQVVPVRVRQRIEARGDSVDTDQWKSFKRQKQFLENNRSPLKKLKQAEALVGCAAVVKANIFPIDTPTLGKRVRKQKRLNPDEIYYGTNKRQKTGLSELDNELSESKRISLRRKKSWVR